MGGTEGELGVSNVFRVARSDELVFKLSWLGFLFMAGILGLMKDGELGSETRELERELKGGWIERPFIFLARLGAGDVMGRSWPTESAAVRPAMVEDRPPNEVPVKEDSGGRFTGDSGDEDGEGSDRDEESVQDLSLIHI